MSQYELAAGRRGVSDQWLREGFADWVKARVIEELGFGPYAESRERVVRAVQRSTEPMPSLRSLSTNRDWTTSRQRLGSAATYGQAFLAAEWLIERFGRVAVVGYFRHAAVTRDADQAFREAFGIPLDRFADEFRDRLAALRGQ